MPLPQGIPVPARVAKRAFEAWEESPGGCYISTYSVASHGYAQIGWQDDDGKMRGTTAHRAAWVHVHGQIPGEMTLDHEKTCDLRCVNVEHLRMLTNFENARRTRGRDWPLGECINGHSNSFLKRQPSGRTRCTECTAQSQRDYRKRTGAAVMNERQRDYRSRKATA